jgi:amino acid transporter
VRAFRRVRLLWEACAPNRMGGSVTTVGSGVENARRGAQEQLRQIGFIPLLAVFYGYTAGGPFGYEGIFKSSGPGMALLFLAFVPLFWSVPISLASAELNAILPVQGGFYRWSRAAFGDFWGFQCGWWNWTGTFLLNGLYGVLAMDYLADYFPWLNGYAKWAGACLVLCLLAYLNARGIQMAGWLAVILLLAILIPVTWLCIVSLFHWKCNPLVPLAPPGRAFGGVFGEGLALAMWNYAGYEQLSSITGEMKEPQRDLVRVLAWNTPMNILTYLVPTALALAVLGNWRQWTTGYIVTAARLIGGQALGTGMLVASLSNSTILYTTRIPATMAEDGYFPVWVGKLSRFGTPARAIAISTAVYCIVAKYRVEDLVNIYIWTRIATSLLTVFAAWRMRVKAPNAARRFRIPGGSIGMLYIVIFPLMLCALKICYSEQLVFRYAPWLLASGPVAYAILRWVFGMKPMPQVT